MAEYIEREAILREIERRESLMVGDKLVSVDAMKSFIKNRPSADVAPVRHGQWERTADGAALCTACKRKMNPSQYGYAFCSLCGAKMDLE